LKAVVRLIYMKIAMTFPEHKTVRGFAGRLYRTVDPVRSFGVRQALVRVLAVY